GGGIGRGAWHVISGLPGERRDDVLDLARVLVRIDEQMRSLRGRKARTLALHWQPFSPLPGTPMQWCAAGTGAKNKIAKFRFLETQLRNGRLFLRQLGGRT